MRLRFPWTGLAIVTAGALLSACVDFNVECVPPVDEPELVVANLAAEVPIGRTVVRTQENGLGNLITDAYRSELSTAVAIENSGSIRDEGVCRSRTSLAKGALTRGLLADTLPFVEDELVMVKVTAEELYRVFEHSVATLKTPVPSGRFLQVSGLIVEVDCLQPAENPRVGVPGSRVQSLTLVHPDGRTESLSREGTAGRRLFLVAMNHYLASGGDGYALLGAKGAEEVLHASPPRKVFDVVEAHLRSIGATAGAPVDLSVDPANPRLLLRNCE